MPLKPDLRRHKIVKDMAGKYTVPIIAEKSFLSEGSVRRIARIYGLSLTVPRWNGADVAEIIRLKDEGKTYAQIAEITGFNKNAIIQKCRVIRGTNNEPMNKIPESKIKTIMEMAGYYRVEDIAKAVGLTANAVRCAAHLRRISTRYYKNKWRPSEEKLLKNMAASGVPYTDIAEKLGRSYWAVNNKLQELGGVKCR